MENEVRIEGIEELKRLWDAYSSESLFRLFDEQFYSLFNQEVLDVLLEAQLTHVEIWKEAKAVAKEIYSLRANPKQIDDFYVWRHKRYEGFFSSEEAQKKSGMLNFAVYHVAYLMMQYMMVKDEEYEKLFKFENEVNKVVQLPSVNEWTGDRDTGVVSCKNLLAYMDALLYPSGFSYNIQYGFSKMVLGALPYDYDYMSGEKRFTWSEEGIDERYLAEYRAILDFVDKINTAKFRGGAFSANRVREIWQDILHDSQVLQKVLKKSSQEQYPEYKFSLRWVCEIMGYLKGKGVYQGVNKEMSGALDPRFVTKTDASQAKRIGDALSKDSELNTLIKQVIDGILS